MTNIFQGCARAAFLLVIGLCLSTALAASGPTCWDDLVKLVAGNPRAATGLINYGDALAVANRDRAVELLATRVVQSRIVPSLEGMADHRATPGYPRAVAEMLETDVKAKAGASIFRAGTVTLNAQGPAGTSRQVVFRYSGFEVDVPSGRRADAQLDGGGLVEGKADVWDGPNLVPSILRTRFEATRAQHLDIYRDARATNQEFFLLIDNRMPDVVRQVFEDVYGDLLNQEGFWVIDGF